MTTINKRDLGWTLYGAKAYFHNSILKYSTGRRGQACTSATSRAGKNEFDLFPVYNK